VNGRTDQRSTRFATMARSIFEQTVATFGRLDAAYNNAGVQNIVAETADAPREDFDRVMAINLRGVWSCMKFELRQMRKQGSGAIVNCSSLGGLVGAPGRPIPDFLALSSRSMYLQICVLPYVILERLEGDRAHFQNAQVI
jgi:NAD(P)-dependent dehydrogenase (short-subunit alcohol dehydrogenase family)